MKLGRMWLGMRATRIGRNKKRKAVEDRFVRPQSVFGSACLATLASPSQYVHNVLRQQARNRRLLEIQLRPTAHLSHLRSTSPRKSAAILARRRLRCAIPALRYQHAKPNSLHPVPQRTIYKFEPGRELRDYSLWRRSERCLENSTETVSKMLRHHSILPQRVTEPKGHVSEFASVASPHSGTQPV